LLVGLFLRVCIVRWVRRRHSKLTRPLSKLPA